MIDAVLRQYAWNLAYADHLTRDVPPELWAESGGPGLENHPAWTLGHLVTGSAMVAEELGVDAAVPEAWVELFQRQGPSDRRLPDTDAERYPPRDEVFDRLASLHADVTAAVRGVDAAFLAGTEEWRFDGFLPTNADTLLFMLVAHENVHLGQLGCWRRRFGLPSAMAAMPRGPLG